MPRCPACGTPDRAVPSPGSRRRRDDGACGRAVHAGRGARATRGSRLAARRHRHATVSTTHTTDETPLPNCASELASARARSARRRSTTAAARIPDPARARAAAIGEAIERYSAMFVPLDGSSGSHGARARRVGRRPARFALFHPAQHDAARLSVRAVHRGHAHALGRGPALADGHAAFLPAELVTSGGRSRACVRSAYSTSSGLACARPCRGDPWPPLLELVERDAVMLAWKCRSVAAAPRLVGRRTASAPRRAFLRLDAALPFAVVDASRLPRRPGRDRRRPRRARVARRARDGRRRRGRRRRRVAQGARRGASACIAGWATPGASRRAADPSLTRSRRSTTTCCFYARRRARGARRRSSTRRRSGRRPLLVPPLDGTTRRGADRRAVVGRLATAGCRPTRSTSPRPTSAPSGSRVARVIAPELCPLDVSHRARFLGGTRLYPAAYDAGLLPGSARRRGTQPSPASVPVSEPSRTLPTVARSTRTVASPHVTGAEEVGRIDRRRTTTRRPACTREIVDPLVLGAARLERSLRCRVSATRSVKRHSHRPHVQLPGPSSGAVDARAGPRDRRSRRAFGRDPPLDRAGDDPRRALRRLRRRSTARRSRCARPRRVARSIRSSSTSPANASAASTPALYHYDPLRHCLERAGGRSVDESSSLCRPYHDSRCERRFVAVTAMFSRSRFKYGARAYRFTLLEAGHVAQNLLLAVAALGLAAVPIGGFYDRKVDASSGSTGSTRHRSTCSRSAAASHESPRVPARRSRWALVGVASARAPASRPSTRASTGRARRSPSGLLAGVPHSWLARPPAPAVRDVIAFRHAGLLARSLVLTVKSAQEEALWRALLLGLLIVPSGGSARSPAARGSSPVPTSVALGEAQRRTSSPGPRSARRTCSPAASTRRSRRTGPTTCSSVRVPLSRRGHVPFGH